MQHSGTSHKGLIFGGLMAKTLIFLRSLHAMRFPTAVWWFSCSVVEQKSVNSVSLTFQFQQFATRILSILHATFTPHHETKAAHYQFSLSRTPPRIMTTSLTMALPPVFVTSFLHEAIVIITIIFEIIILISRFPNLRKNFLREVSGTEVLFMQQSFLCLL